MKQRRCFSHCTISLKTALDVKERDRLLLDDNIQSLEKHVQRLKDEISAWERKDDGAKTRLRQLEMDKDREVRAERNEIFRILLLKLFCSSFFICRPFN